MVKAEVANANAMRSATIKIEAVNALIDSMAPSFVGVYTQKSSSTLPTLHLFFQSELGTMTGSFVQFYHVDF